MKQLDYYGNQFKWFVGVVKDEIETGRVRVRCFGVHPFEPNGLADGPAYQAVSNGDLPWASVLMPNNETAVSHNLQPEDWVFGFFADGDACQQPVVVGKVPRGDTPSTEDSTPSQGDSTTGTGEATSGGNQTSGQTSTPSPGAIPDVEIPTAKPKNENYYNVIPGDTNMQKTFNLFATFFIEEMKVEKERALMISAGICGSIQGESNFNPNAQYNGPLHNKDPRTITQWSRAYGLCQWLGKRKKALYDMCKPGDLTCQLNFTLSELMKRNYGHSSEGSEVAALKKLTVCNTVDQAADAWTLGFERPYPATNPEMGNLKLRRKYAQNVYFTCKDKFQPAKIVFTKDRYDRNV